MNIDQDNQQERSKIDSQWLLEIKSKVELIWFIVGFADGEGSLHVSFRPRQDYKHNWKISLCFNISQKERPILAKIKAFFGCGTLRERSDDVWYYEVNNQLMLRQRIIPFFSKYNFRTVKNLNRFQGFVKISDILDKDLTISHIAKILDIRDKYLQPGKTKYTNEFIMKSSETNTPDTF
jgi:hypothetical protein